MSEVAFGDMKPTHAVIDRFVADQRVTLAFNQKARPPNPSPDRAVPAQQMAHPLNPVSEAIGALRNVLVHSMPRSVNAEAELSQDRRSP